MVLKFGKKSGGRNFDGKISPQHKLVHAKCMQHANLDPWGGTFQRYIVDVFSQVPFSMLCMSFCFGAMSFHELTTISSALPELKRSK